MSETASVLRVIVTLADDSILSWDGDVEFCAVEGRLTVHNYDLRKRVPQFCGLVFLAEPGEWKRAHVVELDTKP